MWKCRRICLCRVCWTCVEGWLLQSRYLIKPRNSDKSGKKQKTLWHNFDNRYIHININITPFICMRCKVTSNIHWSAVVSGAAGRDGWRYWISFDKLSFQFCGVRLQDCGWARHFAPTPSLLSVISVLISCYLKYLKLCTTSYNISLSWHHNVSII